MPAEVRALLEAAGVQDAMPPRPRAPVDLEPRSYYDTAGPDWVWGEPTEGACTGSTLACWQLLHDAVLRQEVSFLPVLH